MGLQKLVAPKKMPHLRTNALKPTGARPFDIYEQLIGGPGDPPPNFINGQNSVTEWYVYWALFKILDPSRNPRQPPFFGLPGRFAYQSSQMGGFVRALGSAVVDFLVYEGGLMIAMRVQTEFFHIFTAARKQAYDSVQKVRLSKLLHVIDLYDQDILGDTSGAKCIVTVKRALGLIENVNPITAGTAIRASRLKNIE